MKYIDLTRADSQAILKLSRGKVNALSEDVLDEIRSQFEELERDDTVRSVTLTGSGAFFCFGFDIPELYTLSREEFTGFLTKFTSLYRYMFLYSKPLVAAINGHAIAGGCMLATACDHRLMVSGKAKISLNEITFGSTVFQSAVEILAFWVGDRVAQNILLSGDMYSAEQARNFGLIDGVSNTEELLSGAAAVAEILGEKNPAAYAHIKKMLRLPAVESVMSHEQETIKEFVDIWYSDSLRENLRQIQIRD